MKQTKSMKWLAAAAFTFALAGGANADSVTTNSYDASSTQDNIAFSCKEFDASGDNVSAKCNVADSNGDVTAADTQINIKQHMTCSRNLDGDWEFVWTSSAFNTVTPADLDVDVSSDGQHYMLEGKCVDGEYRLDATPLDLSDIQVGLENDDGSLARRLIM